VFLICSAALREFLSRDFRHVHVDMTIHPTLDGGERSTAYFTLRG
jgi:hypothetical protein